MSFIENKGNVAISFIMFSTYVCAPIFVLAVHTSYSVPRMEKGG